VVAYDFKRERFNQILKCFFFIDKKSKETVRQPNKKIRYHEFGSGVLGEELKAQVDLSSISCINCNGPHHIKNCPFPKNQLKIRANLAAHKRRRYAIFCFHLLLNYAKIIVTLGHGIFIMNHLNVLMNLTAALKNRMKWLH
jgi:ribulose-5-phosphate 4-epimerase/fuculose-1-phosphate aldolase